MRRELRLASGETVSLTQRECDLLRYLSDRPGTLVSRDELQREVWGHPPSVISRAADTAISRLRAKVEADIRRPRHVITIRGEGVRFVPLADESPNQGSPVLPETAPTILKLGATRLDLARGLARVGSRSIALTGTECGVLECLPNDNYFSPPATTTFPHR